MKSRGWAVGQSQRDHRLPHGLLDARAVVEPTSSSISRDTRSRSPRCGQNELEIKREDSKAEEERRDTFLNKWEDDGQDLLDELESNDRMVFLLQEPHSSHHSRARCRAVNCIHGSYITDNYRICVDTGRSYNGKHYYHVRCSERMIDLKKLLPSKFKIDGPLWLWGLMIRQWFEHQGNINLNKIVEFLEGRDAYNQENREFSGEWITWSNNHKKCEAEPGICSCPPPPKGPDKPVLKDYTTSDQDACNLSDVLAHPRVDDPQEEFIASPFFIENMGG